MEDWELMAPITLGLALDMTAPAVTSDMTAPSVIVQAAGSRFTESEAFDDETQERKEESASNMTAPAVTVQPAASPYDEIQDMAVLSLYSKEEMCDDDLAQQNRDKAHSRLRFQRGCGDLDSSICVLTPMFQAGRGMDGQISINFGDNTLSYSGTSPPKRLEANPMVVEIVAECTYRLEALEEVVQHGTAFAASPTAIVTAGHLLFPESRSDYYTIINCIPAGKSMFSNVKIDKGSLLKAQIGTSDTLPRMTDPISGDFYSTDGDNMDAAILFLSQRAMYRGRPIKRLNKFLLPMSLIDAISMYGQNGRLAIGVCGFPMVTEFMRKVRSSNKDDQTYIFQTYKLCVASYWKGLQEEKTSERERKLLLLSKIVELLENTFAGFSTGSMAFSVGRLIGYNDTSIASSYTCLQGSSGSPLFSPDIPFSGVFLGIHNAPAEKMVLPRGEVFPDYNVATSTDNLAFVKHYVSQVLPTLPPSAFTSNDKQRMKVFCLWMWRHLNFIIASKNEITGGNEWSKEHARWFNIMLDELDAASTLIIQFTDEEGKKLIRRCKEMKPELYAVYSQCRIHANTEEFGAMLEGLEALLSVLMLIAPKVRETGLSLCAWGFPKSCAARSVHMLQKVALMLE